MDLPKLAPDSFHRLPHHSLASAEQPGSSTSAGSLPCTSRAAEQPEDRHVRPDSVRSVLANSQLESELDEEQSSKLLTTSFTVGSNNQLRNYYVLVQPAALGSTPADNVGSKVPEPMEDVLSPGSSLRNDIQDLKHRLPSIMEECAPDTYPHSDVPSGQVHHSTHHAGSKRPGAASMHSRATHGSTRTLTGTGTYLQVMYQKDLKLPNSLPYYMQTYTRELSFNLCHSKQAICLWGPYPNQNLPQGLQEKHCTLGDVGVFDQHGNFEVFFNIFMSREENAQMLYRPPEDFEPLVVAQYEYIKPVQEDEVQFCTEDFKAHNAKNMETGKFSFVFESIQRPAAAGGAILALPDGYIMGTLLGSVIQEINFYLQEHIESWYSTTNHWNSNNSLPNGALKLISTCYKSPIWGAAMLPQDEYRPGIELKMERLSFNERYKWNTTDHGASVRLNHGSTKRDAKDIRYTIAVEVLSVYRTLPRTKRNFFTSFTSNKTAGSRATASKSSLRSRLTKSFTNSLSRLSIS